MENEKRLIYMEDAYEAVTDLSGQAETKSAYAAFWKAGKEIQKLPTVEAVEVVRSKWVLAEDGKLICDHCKSVKVAHEQLWYLRSTGCWNYCPNCGADMR